MMISLNGPTPNSELADKLIRKVAVRFESSRRHKRPIATRIFPTKSSSSVSVQMDNILCLESIDAEQESQASNKEIKILEEHLGISVKNVESWVADLQSEVEKQRRNKQ